MINKFAQTKHPSQHNREMKNGRFEEMTTRANKILVNYPLRLITVGQGEKMKIKMIHTANSQVIMEFTSKKPKDFIDIIWQVAGLTVD